MRLASAVVVLAAVASAAEKEPRRQTTSPLTVARHSDKYVKSFVRKYGGKLSTGPVDMALKDLTKLYERLPKALKVVVAPNFGSLVRTLHSVRGELNVMRNDLLVEPVSENMESSARVGKSVMDLVTRSMTAKWLTPEQKCGSVVILKWK